MEWTWWFIVVTFFSGLYVCLNYTSGAFTEGFKTRCPNLLIQEGNELWLKNTNLADIPGVNPVVFHSLDEYTEFVDWQKSQGIHCPILYLQKTYDAQNTAVYKMKPPPLHLMDATRNDPPYNKNSYPGMDPMNQNIGDNTMLDEYHTIGETQTTSKNAMDPNWAA
jgi:hypothetical protein